MKKVFLLSIALLFYNLLFSQVIYEEINSKKLNSTRQIKIQLPRNYEENTQKKYPIILVLDGDYLFEPVAGNVDFYSYWEDMPQSIVVGIMQGDKRYKTVSSTGQRNSQVGKAQIFLSFWEWNFCHTLEINIARSISW